MIPLWFPFILVIPLTFLVWRSSRSDREEVRFAVRFIYMVGMACGMLIGLVFGEHGIK